MNTMKPGNILYVFLLGWVVIALLSCAGTTPPKSSQRQPSENISPAEAYTLIQEHRADLDFVILDVRTPEEFAQEHLEHAVNLDYQGPTFREQLEILNKQKTYLVYCKSEKRTEKAFQLMKELHFPYIYNMTGGIDQWSKDKLPVVK